MNLLGRILFGIQPSTTALPTSPTAVEPYVPLPLGGCPDCGGVESTLVCKLYGWRRDSGEEPFVGEIGARLSCQRCPCIYSVGPLGTFKQHPRSLPPMFQMPEPRPEGAQAETRKPPPLRDPMPVPRERPRA